MTNLEETIRSVRSVKSWKRLNDAENMKMVAKVVRLYLEDHPALITTELLSSFDALRVMGYVNSNYNPHLKSPEGFRRLRLAEAIASVLGLKGYEVNISRVDQEALAAKDRYQGQSLRGLGRDDIYFRDQKGLRDYLTPKIGKKGRIVVVEFDMTKGVP